MDLKIMVNPYKGDKNSTRICSVDLEFDHSLRIDGFFIWTGDDKRIHLVSPKYVADTFDPDGNFEKKSAVTFKDLRLRDEIIREAREMVENSPEEPSEKIIRFPVGDFHIDGKTVRYHTISVGNAVEIHGIVAIKGEKGKEVKLPAGRAHGKDKEIITFTDMETAKKLYQKIKV